MKIRLFRWNLLLIAFLVLLASLHAAAQVNKKTTPSAPPPPPPRSAPAPAPRAEPRPEPRSEPRPEPRQQPRPEPSRPAPAPYRPEPQRPSEAPNRPSPAPRPTAPSSNNPPRQYTPGQSQSRPGQPASNQPGSSQPRPSQPSAPRVYTPGAHSPQAPAAAEPGSGAKSGSGTVYTPHAGNSAPADNHGGGGANGGRRTASGTVFTPHAGGSAAAAGEGHGSSSPAGSARGATHPVYEIPHSASGRTAGPLAPADGQHVVHDVNAARARLSGVNHRPLPAGTVTPRSNGGVTIAAAGGRQYGVRPNGTLSSYQGHNERIAFDERGKVRALHAGNLDISHGPHGARTIVVRRADHSVLVRTGRHSGYLDRPVMRGGRTYVQRTYVSGRSRYFSEYRYHGAMLNNYLPGAYYPPEFYGWAYYGWQGRVGFNWGWAGQAWLGFYNGYFAPSGEYDGAASWLTDYVLGQTMQDGYAEAQSDDGGGEPADAAPAAGEQEPDDAIAQQDTPITPELKQEIVAETDRQISYENAAASAPDQAPSVAGLPQEMVANALFVVDTPLAVVALDGETCPLSTGNVLRLQLPPNEEAQAATLVVAASRAGDCTAGWQVNLSLDQLQDMVNAYRARIDAGLAQLRETQGKDGLPAAPASAMAAPRPGEAASAAGSASQPVVAGMLDGAAREANQSEAQAVQTAFADPSAAAAKQR